MNIPETLLKLPEKELKKLLSEENIYKARFVIKDGEIREVDKKFKSFVFFKNGKTTLIDSFREYYTPLSLTLLNTLKRQEITRAINLWPYEQWYNWCAKQFIHSYGEEYIDATSSPYIFVHFPEITITNSVEQSHIIRDLYLRFEIKTYAISLTGLKRGTLTDVELRNKYTFSHVNNDNDCFTWAKQFCFGDTEIAQLKGLISGGRRVEVFRHLSFFLEALKEYLSWESLEGVPYKKIDDVIYDKNLWREVSLPSSPELLDFTLKHLESFTYEFDTNTEGYCVKIDSNSREAIANLLTENFPDYCSLYLEGRSVEKRETHVDNYDFPDFFPWKGGYRPFKLLTVSNTNIELPKRINMSVLNSVCASIETMFNNYLKQMKLDEYNAQN